MAGELGGTVQLRSAPFSSVQLRSAPLGSARLRSVPFDSISSAQLSQPTTVLTQSQLLAGGALFTRPASRAIKEHHSRHQLRTKRHQTAPDGTSGADTAFLRR